MLQKLFIEPGHECRKSVFPHCRDGRVVLVALTEEGVRPGFDGIGLEQTVHSEALAGLAEDGQEGDGEGRDKQHAVAAVGAADVRLAQPHPEARILGIAERRLDRPALGVEVDQARAAGLWIACGKAPRILHAPGMDADDGGHDEFIVGDARLTQRLRATALTNPVSLRVVVA